ncbi:MAG: hypothetical protein JO320_19045 [Alphaproteobacteria bacterium]|nr:hypothetical protein [Alphaproteobacteria bacterium]
MTPQGAKARVNLIRVPTIAWPTGYREQKGAGGFAANRAKTEIRWTAVQASALADGAVSYPT